MSNLERKSQMIGNKPALIVVDIINGFTDPACPLGGEYPQVIAANKKLLAAFRAKGLPVFFTTVIYTAKEQAQVFRKRLPALNILTPESKWVKVDERLKRQDTEVLIKKHWASAFFKTNLDMQLRARNVDSLIITGLTTSGCVRASAVDGLQYDYRVFVPREAVGDRNEKAHDANLFDLHAKYADVVSLEKILMMIEE